VNFQKNQPAAWCVSWLLMVVIALLGRTYLPVDETRYVTVAWNMWLRDDYLVPWLNGAPYSHKPPLLFWLMNAGWAVFGINDWWPRLVPALFALVSMFLTARLARRLWPEEPMNAVLAPVILLGSALWMVFATATMFDMLIACFTLLGMLGVLMAWQGSPRRGWALVGMAIGLGLLAKGPTILLQILPAALLAPWWGRTAPRSWKSWYAGMLGAILLGVTVALLWAVPAGLRGGEEYRHAIFWGQTAQRMVDSFAHKRPLWWYLPTLPLLIFPWLWWSRAWRALAQLPHVREEFGVRFCLAWLVPVFLAFCLISGKQVHYLLPLLPAFALLLARLLSRTVPTRWDEVPLALFLVTVGVAFMVLPRHATQFGLPLWVGDMEIWPGAVLTVVGVVLLARRGSHLLAEVWRLAFYSALAIHLALFVGVMHNGGLAFDIRPLAQRLQTLQQQGVPLVHVGDYAGQYQFVGRLRQEIPSVERPVLAQWFQANPDGKAVVYFRERRSLDGVPVDYQQPYLDQIVAILGREAWPVPSPRAP
jgi:4-amino-4-deoxy-L-arabinose transferase-like glycosyltransferase